MPKVFTIIIDGEDFEAPEKTMSANEVLALGELSTTDYYLVEIKGKTQDSFQGEGGKDIHLHQGSKFISVFIGATPVADVQLVGAALFASQLTSAGYDVVEMPDGHLKFPYKVEIGKHVGTVLEMGFVVPPDFPLTAPHGPHVSKHIHPLKGGGVHPEGGIHSSPGHSKHFDDSWQHWSRPHPAWAEGNRDAVRYMAFIRNLWASQ